MPDDIRPIDYFYATVPDRPGEAARVLSTLQHAGINLLGVSAFPHGARRSQLDLIPEDSATFMKASKSLGLKLSKKKSGFLIWGDDRPGAIAEITQKLAQAKINITSVQAFCAGSGRYGGMLWVKPTDLRKAAKAIADGVSTPGSASSELATRLKPALRCAAGVRLMAELSQPRCPAHALMELCLLAAVSPKPSSNTFQRTKDVRILREPETTSPHP